MSTFQLPWYSAGPLPPRRHKAKGQSRHAKRLVKETLFLPGTPLSFSDTSSQTLAQTAIPLATPPLISPLNVKAAPKSWSALLKSSSSNGSVMSGVNGVNGVKAHSFTNLPNLLSRYDPSHHAYSPVIRPRGLINKGNMCFMNAILQILVYCPPFYNLFDRIGKEVPQKMSSKTPLMDAMVMFIQEFQVVSEASQETPDGDVVVQTTIEQLGEAFAPDNIYKSMRGNPKFNSMQRGHQEDAEEFLGFLLDGLHEEFLEALETSSENGHDKVTNETRGADVKSSDWLEVGKKQRTMHTRTATVVESPITKIFGGNVRSIFKVQGTKDSITLEPYQPLQLDIQSPDVKDIMDALKQIPEPELIADDWKNSQGMRVNAYKQVFIESLPPVLILHLKRFLYDNVGGTQKSWKQVGYPLELEIPQQALSPNRRDSTKRKYKLIGVVYHHGMSAQGGHYTVDVLRQDSKSWIHMDDTSIELVKGKEVAVQRQEEEDYNFIKPSRLAYILFYASVE